MIKIENMNLNVFVSNANDLKDILKDVMGGLEINKTNIVTKIGDTKEVKQETNTQPKVTGKVETKKTETINKVEENKSDESSEKNFCKEEIQERVHAATHYSFTDSDYLYLYAYYRSIIQLDEMIYMIGNEFLKISGDRAEMKKVYDSELETGADLPSLNYSLEKDDMKSVLDNVNMSIFITRAKGCAVLLKDEGDKLINIRVNASETGLINYASIREKFPKIMGIDLGRIKAKHLELFGDNTPAYAQVNY